MTSPKIPHGYSVETTTIRYRNVKNPRLGHSKIVTLVRYPDGKIVRFTERLSKGEAVRQAIALRKREEARGGHHAVTERDARRSRSTKGRRDPMTPTTLPKSMVPKKRAIERATRALNESVLHSDERRKALYKIYSAVDRLTHHARYKEEWSYAQANVLEDELRKAAHAAHEQAQENYRKHNEEQAAYYRQKHREAQPVPGTYEHELALMKGGYRRDSSRAKRSTRRADR